MSRARFFYIYYLISAGAAYRNVLNTRNSNFAMRAYFITLTFHAAAFARNNVTHCTHISTISVCGVEVPMLLTAGECVWLDLTLIERVVKHSREMFPVVRYAFSSVPTYPSGTIGYLLASSNCVSSCICVCLRVYNTVEPGHVGNEFFVHYSEVVPSSHMTIYSCWQEARSLSIVGRLSAL